MRVLLADRLPDQARVRLAAGGFEVRTDASLNGEALQRVLASFDPEVLVVRSTKVESRHLEVARSLGLVVRAGAGVNTIDLDACSGGGIYVANCPGKNAVAVAELTLGLMLAVDRSIPDNVGDFRAGKWDKARYSKADGLAGRTLGIIGLGSIGVEVARRAQAFGMTVLAWSRSLTDEGASGLGIRRYDTPEEVARRADVLSVHLALTPETRGFVGESILGELKRGAIVVNTARAEVMDSGAFASALERQSLRAGLDVIQGEPAFKSGAFEHPLRDHPRVYVTHHIGASTEQAQMAVAEEACRILEGYRDTGEVANVVNLAWEPEADGLLVVRHLDRVGVLARVLASLQAADINVEQMANSVFSGARAAIARIHVRGELTASVIAEIESHEHVLGVKAMAAEPEGE